MLTLPNAVIFDLDGTLLDSVADIADAANFSLAAHGLSTHSVDAYKLFVGEGVVNMFKKAAPDASDVMPMVALWKEKYDSSWANKTAPYPGIVAMLRKLVAADIPLAVLSNKIDSFTRTIVDHFFPDIPFAEVWGHRENQPPKPHPQSALQIAMALKAAPQQMYFMGDSKIDMQTADRANMISIGVTWGFRTEAELRAHKARAIIHHPDELFGCWGAVC